MITPNLNRRIQVQQQITAQDGFGQPLSAWATVYSCWAEIDVQQSQLLYAPSEFVSKTIYRITIRWTKSVVFEPNMRVVYTEQSTNVTHTYNIEGLLNPKQSNFWLTLLCYELDGAA